MSYCYNGGRSGHPDSTTRHQPMGVPSSATCNAELSDDHATTVAPNREGRSTPTPRTVISQVDPTIPAMHRSARDLSHACARASPSGRGAVVAGVGTMTQQTRKAWNSIPKTKYIVLRYEGFWKTFRPQRLALLNI